LVLIVDDDPDTRFLYSLVFESAGFRAAGASSVREGVEAAHTLRPDVIVTDWLLPDGRGLDVCAALHRHPRARRIVKLAVSGLDFDDAATAEARAVGCDPVLLKPVSPDVLVETVARALEARTTRMLRAAALRVGRAARSASGRAALARTVDELRVAADDLLHQPAANRAPGVALILADDDGHYVAANTDAAVLTGYDARELTRLSVWDLTPGVAAAAGHALWSRFIEVGFQEGRYVMTTRSGEAVEATYVAIANVAPGLHLSALAACP
jgi:CheY-like chemotaxis protein